MFSLRGWMSSLLTGLGKLLLLSRAMVVRLISVGRVVIRSVVRVVLDYRRILAWTTDGWLRLTLATSSEKDAKETK